MGAEYPLEQEFDLVAQVKMGSPIDAAITPGPGADIDFDGSGCRFRIYAMGE